jgi:hypothetical protein
MPFKYDAVCPMPKPLYLWSGKTPQWHSCPPAQRKTAVVKYADDGAIFVNTPGGIPAIREAIRCYEKTTGAVLSTVKSQALAVGRWETTRRVLEIPYIAELKVLGSGLRPLWHSPDYPVGHGSLTWCELRRGRHVAGT